MVGLVALAPGAQAGGPKISTILKDTWVGSYEGYASAEKEHITGQQKFAITKTQGRAAIGTWQSKSVANPKWSSPKPITLTIFPNDASGYVVYGADGGGAYSGELSSSGVLTLGCSYIAEDPVTIQIGMKKKK